MDGHARVDELADGRDQHGAPLRRPLDRRSARGNADAVVAGAGGRARALDGGIEYHRFWVKLWERLSRR